MRHGSRRRRRRGAGCPRWSRVGRRRSLARRSNDLRSATFCAGSPTIRPISGRWSTDDPARLARLLSAPPEDSLDALIRALGERRDDEEAALMRALRDAKRESALLVALADIGGVWDVVAATEALTRFADAAVSAALAFLLRAGARAEKAGARSGRRRYRGALRPRRAGARQAGRAGTQLFERYRPDRSLRRGCGLDPRGQEPGPLFVRIAKALARILQERTSDGYVLRVDLRLRPDPASTPVALSTASAYAYYETRRPELGARRADQGASRRRRPGARARNFSGSSPLSSGANISTMPRSPTSTR